MSGHSQAACLSKRTDTPWPAPKLALEDMPRLQMSQSQRGWNQGGSLESVSPESQLGGRFTGETHMATRRILRGLWKPLGTGCGEGAHVKLQPCQTGGVPHLAPWTPSVLFRKSGGQLVWYKEKIPALFPSLSASMAQIFQINGRNVKTGKVPSSTDVLGSACLMAPVSLESMWRTRLSIPLA